MGASSVLALDFQTGRLHRIDAVLWEVYTQSGETLLPIFEVDDFPRKKTDQIRGPLIPLSAQRSGIKATELITDDLESPVRIGLPAVPIHVKSEEELGGFAVIWWYHGTTSPFTFILSSRGALSGRISHV